MRLQFDREFHQLRELALSEEDKSKLTLVAKSHIVSVWIVSGEVELVRGPYSDSKMRPIAAFQFLQSLQMSLCYRSRRCLSG